MSETTRQERQAPCLSGGCPVAITMDGDIKAVKRGQAIIITLLIATLGTHGWNYVKLQDFKNEQTKAASILNVAISMITGKLESTETAVNNHIASNYYEKCRTKFEEVDKRVSYLEIIMDKKISMNVKNSSKK